MIRTESRWLRVLADLVDSGEVEIGRVELRPRGILLGVFEPGTFAQREAAAPATGQETA